ncbi:hypothetical protein DFH94DRAFT_857820 [Russula ochroleuca]|uniref:Uncharacterized protein n=1 Tax=Russula ochroleuca TaxID=152965 RepID=A0A9P5MMR7_9AGAM|nr:hypothetical protein DFH94DRAFT_857820 [Russula ochroleuca]
MSADAPSSWGDSNLTTIIAGCVASFIVTISITIATICIRLRRRSQALPAVSAGVGASQPHVDEIPRPLPDDASSSLPGRPMTVRPHDPKDPTTFPGCQGDPHSQHSQAPKSLYIASGSTLVNTQTSLPQAKGYHGLPTV